MKKLSFIITFVFLSILFVQTQQAKYVFISSEMEWVLTKFLAQRCIVQSWKVK